MSGAMKLFNLVMNANPIFLLITLIAALAAWGISLVDDWTPVTSFFANLWEGVKQRFISAWETFKFLLSWSPIGLMIRAWEPLKKFFSYLWEGIKTVFSSPLAFIRTLLSWTPLGLIIRAWDPLLGFFSSMWDSIKVMTSGFVDWLVSAVMGPVNDIMTAISDVWSWFSGDSPEAEVIKTVRQSEGGNTALATTENMGVNSASDTPGVKVGQRPAVLQTGFKSQNTGSNFVDQSQTHFAIETSPGMDAEAIALAVQKKLDERDRQNSRRTRGRHTDS
tara:strand:- start:311 stop:1141 length:831 start_codon:yes stop_codon:yes gene_type:complete